MYRIDYVFVSVLTVPILFSLLTHIHIGEVSAYAGSAKSINGRS